MKTFRIKLPSNSTASVSILEILTKTTKLAPLVLNEIAFKGALWFQKGSRGKIIRLRDLEGEIRSCDSLTIYYEPKILSIPTLKDVPCLFQNEHYSVWLKAAGVLAQGSQVGDHASLLRYVELQKKREVYLIHRLDRETEGIMILGHSSKAASKLSYLFQNNLIKKTYEAICLGEMTVGTRGVIEKLLDDKTATTHYLVLESSSGKSRLELTIDTGRFHQIRRHLDSLGHPIIGDPTYGKGNKNRDGLKLLARSLEFIDPWDNKSVIFKIDKRLFI